jgi:hypothetical protein
VRGLVLQSAHTVYGELDLSQFPTCQVALDGRGALQREAVEAAGVRYIAIGDGNGFASARPAAGEPVANDGSAAVSNEAETCRSRRGSAVR